MARKQIISCDILLDHAWEIAKSEGILAVTSRSVAASVGCSIQPVFSHFPTMEDLRKATFVYACNRLEQDYQSDIIRVQDPLDDIVHRLLDVARNQPHLYRLCYLSGNDYCQGPENPAMKFQSNRMFLQKLQADTGLDIITCQDIFLRALMMIYGIATMVCVNGLDCSEEKAKEMVVHTVKDMIFSASRNK